MQTFDIVKISMQTLWTVNISKIGKQIKTGLGLFSVSLSNVMYCVYDLFVS